MYTNALIIPISFYLLLFISLLTIFLNAYTTPQLGFQCFSIVTCQDATFIALS